MGKVIHHIHPHVMGHHDHRDNANHHDFFSNFSNHINHNHGNRHVHSFTASYSNVNGHVHRHFSRNGHHVNAKDAMQQMNAMDREMDRSFKQMDRAFGGLGHDGFGSFLNDDQTHDRKRHPFRRLFGHHSQNGNLTHRIKH